MANCQPRARRMRVTLSSDLANSYLLPILSPVFHMGETHGVPLIITMDYGTFGKFMTAVCEHDGGQKVASLRIEEVDVAKEPRRLVFNHGRLYDEESLR